MTVEITTITQYTENFIPFEWFVLVFVFGMIFLILSVLAKKGNIIFSALSAITNIFLIYSTFFLRWNTTYVPITTTTAEGVTIVSEIANVNEMFLSVPTLWFLIGMFAFSIVTLWINIGYYTQNALEDSIKKNKNIKDEGGML